MTKVIPTTHEVYRSFYDRVKSVEREPSFIREQFGKIGLDIYEGRTPTILSADDIRESKKLINRIKKWWSGTGKFDYEQNDCLFNIILKYALNKKSGTVKEIEEMFGKEGVSELKSMRYMGLII